MLSHDIENWAIGTIKPPQLTLNNRQHLGCKKEAERDHTARKPCDLFALMPDFLKARASTRSALSSFVLCAYGIFSKSPEARPSRHAATDATCLTARSLVWNVRLHTGHLPLSLRLQCVGACVRTTHEWRLPAEPHEKDFVGRLVGLVTGDASAWERRNPFASPFIIHGCSPMQLAQACET